MSLLDSDAEELKKKAAENISQGSGRSVRSAGLGAFKTLNKYKHLTDKHRQKTEAAVEQSRGTIEPTENQVKFHPIQNSPALPAPIKSGDNQVMVHPIKVTTETPKVDQSDDSKSGDNQVTVHPIQVGKADSTVEIKSVKSGEISPNTSDVLSAPADINVERRVEVSKTKQIDSDRVKISSNQSKSGPSDDNRVNDHPIKEVKTSPNEPVHSDSVLKGELPKSGEVSPNIGDPQNEPSPNSNQVTVHPIQAAQAAESISANELTRDSKSGEYRVKDHPITETAIKVAPSESGDNQVTVHPIYSVEQSRGTNDPDVAGAGIRQEKATSVSIDSPRATKQAGEVSVPTVTEVDRAGESASGQHLPTEPGRAQTLSETKSNTSPNSSTTIEQTSSESSAAELSTNRVKRNQVVTGLQENESGENSPLKTPSPGYKSGVNQVNTRLPFTQLPISGLSTVVLTRKQLSIIEHIFNICSVQPDRISPPLSRRDISEALGINTETAKSALRVLKVEGFLHAHSFSAGKSGWTRYYLDENVFIELMQSRGRHPIQAVKSGDIPGYKSGDMTSRQIDRNINNNNLSISRIDLGWFMALDFSALPQSFKPGMVNRSIRQLVEESLPREDVQDFLNRFPQFLADQNAAKITSPVAFFCEQLKLFASGHTAVLDYPTTDELLVQAEWAVEVQKTQAKAALVQKVKDEEARNQAVAEFEAWFATASTSDLEKLLPRSLMMSGEDFDGAYKASIRGVYLTKREDQAKV